MLADNIYSKTEIGKIPKNNLIEIIEGELTGLLFDFGQKITQHDQEFEYLVSRCVDILRYNYSSWKLHYLDECLRRGKLDEYDKGQRVTMKRLEYWFKSFNITTKDALKDQYTDRDHTQAEIKQFEANAERFVPLIRFRQVRSPEYDEEQWTLMEIEKLADFQKWNRLHGKSQTNIKSLIPNDFRL